MDKTIKFRLNGKSRTVTTDPNRSLLQVLREEFHLSGTKYGCGEGACRACTVLVNDRGIASCITPVSAVERKSVQTIEGLATEGRLHPVQEAFLAENAYQCGCCIPGMIMGTVALLKEKPKPTDAEVQSHMEAHLCRCCGYPRILKAIHRAAAQSRK